MKYTIGRWSTRGLKIWSNSFKKIAEIEILDGEYGKYESSDNAMLISKAPEMYEALKQVKTDINIIGQVSSATLVKVIEVLKELKS